MDSLGRGGVKGHAKRGLALQLHQGRPLLDSAGVVRAGDLNLAGFNSRVEGHRDGQSRSVLRGQLHLALVPEQVGRVAAGDGDSAVVQLGSDNGGGVQLLNLAGEADVMADVSQVDSVHLAVAIEIIVRVARAQLAVHGSQVILVDLAVVVYIAQGEGAVPGAQDENLGEAVQCDGGLEGLIAVAGKSQLVLRPFSGQAGELYLIIT